MESAALLAPTFLTLDPWAERDEDEPGELVDDWLEEDEMSGFLHEVIVPWLIGEFRTWLRPQGGWVLGSKGKYAVTA